MQPILKCFCTLLLLLTITRLSVRADFLIDNIRHIATSANVSDKCRKQLDTTIQNLSLAWKFFDASSKYPITGMSYSNNRDLGNYDECMSIEHEDFDGRILGKYCPYSLVFINPLLPEIPNPYPILTEDPEPPAPYTKTMLSICIPDACTPQEIGAGLSIIPLIVVSDMLPCVTKETNTEIEWYDALFIAFFSLILLCIILSTAFDYITQSEDKKKYRSNLYLSFSLITNSEKLFKISHAKNKDQIECFNGMRFISMAWIIAGHNWTAVEYLPLINYAEIKDWIGNPRIQYIAAAPLAVDTFFFMAGFLLAYGYLKAAFKAPVIQQCASIPVMIIHRYLRLTPAVAMLYFVQITIYRLLGSGPLWDYLQQDQGDRCRKIWWPFFLYIQNYYDWENMCLQWTWYLSADMQMFVLASILMIPIAVLVRRNKTVIAVIFLSFLSVICVLIPIVYRLVDTTYTNDVDTHARLCDYVMGMLMGVLFKQYLQNRKFYFSELWNVVIWIIVLGIDVGFNIYYHHVIVNYTRLSNTLYYGLYKPVWCMSVAWILYSCYHGYGGVVNYILTLPFFQIGARLSYCMYLLHFSVIMYWTSMYRTDYYWGDYNTFYVWCGHFIVTLLLSVVWTLAFESPMIGISKIIIGYIEKLMAMAVPKRPQRDETKQ